jgi:hypothetical protein
VPAGGREFAFKNRKNMDGLIEIKNDLYGIAARIGEIDGCYRVFFNVPTMRYEVHNARGCQAILPYAELDARAVSYVLETRSERKKAFIEEIERHNSEFERIENNKLKDSFQEKAERVLGTIMK